MVAALGSGHGAGGRGASGRDASSRRAIHRMSFHPNDIARRARIGTILIVVLMITLLSGFFNTQVLQHERYALQSEENRLREVPLPALRGIIYDRKNNVIAENL